jgi:MoaA/NifB/PqqE/SkfB family radical SAM enzyme
MVNLKKLREFLRCNVLNVFPSVIQSIGVSPIFANIRLTQRCSSRCQSCAHWLNPETSELTTEQWKNILEALRRAGYIGVSFTGGDIFSRPDWHELLAFSLNQGLNVNFTTNGLLLDEDAAKTLKNLAVSSILISLDDLTENFDEIRGVKDGAQKAMAAIELLKKYRNPATSLGIAVTVMKNNVSAFQEVVQYGLKNNLAIRIYPIHFTHYFFNVNFAIQQYRLSDQERQTLRQTLKQMMGLRASHKELMPKLAHLMWVYDYRSCVF